MVDLDKLVSSAESLDPLPASVSQLASLLCSSEWSIEEVERIITFDPSLSLRILAAANSAALASADPVTKVRQAVMRLGTGRVLSLATAAAVRGPLKGSLPEYDLERGALWRHSVTAALAAEVAPELCREAIPQEAFTAALLHDLGKILVAQHLTDDVLDWLRRAREEDGLPMREAEMAVLSIHHGELGGLAARHWNLPEPLVKGIQYHHDPDQGDDIICDVVWLANLVAHQIFDGDATGEGAPDEGARWSAFDPDVLTRLGISQDDLPRMVEATRAKTEALLALYE